jgi:general nucleoside transport system permease protein
VTTATETAPAQEAQAPEPRKPRSDTFLVTVLSFVLALAVGGVLIAVSNKAVLDASKYFFAAPLDTLSAAWSAISGAYVALFQGAVFDPGRAGEGFLSGFYPLTETVTVALPLICTGLAVTIAFRAGLFNIGGQGQLIIGAICASYVGFAITLPPVIHLLAAVLAGILGGAVWGGLVGVLKARTGAHEVITSIMLNYVALYLGAYLLSTDAFLREGRIDPISPPVQSTAEYPLILGDSFRLHLGLFFVLGAVLLVQWLLSGSTIGFRFRAVGQNSAAARTAGISVNRVYIVVMSLAGALAGLGATMQILGTEKSLTIGVAGTLGFDGITVALLGRSTPWGTAAAGLLFGGLRAGGVTMQATTGTKIDIILVLQALVVLFIAAPPFVRAVFRLKDRSSGSALPVSKGWNA